MDTTGSRSDWISGTAATTTGLGILTFAFFPFAMPILILTLVATLLLALPLLAFAAVAAILTGVWLGIRAVVRGIRRLAQNLGSPSVTRTDAALTDRDGLRGTLAELQ